MEFRKTQVIKVTNRQIHIRKVRKKRGRKNERKKTKSGSHDQYVFEYLLLICITLMPTLVCLSKCE